MFETLTTRLARTVDSLRGRGRITEDNVGETLREVRMALLEADVALPVIKSFIEAVKTKALGAEVAQSLTRGDALSAHARDELGLDELRRARPFQAAWTSALAFSAGASLPLLAVAVSPEAARVGVVVAVTLLALGLLGDLGARLGGAPRRPATLRVVAWGAGAMAVTAAIGALVGSAI